LFYEDIPYTILWNPVGGGCAGHYPVLFEGAFMATCYYKILGISVRASQDEIKRAFRMLALRWHPDRNPHDPFAAERFREALDAYENLIDPSRRGHYDKVGRYGRSKTHARRHDRRPRSQRTSSYTLDEILSELFGFDYKQPKHHRRNDLRFDLQILRSAAISGTNEEIVFQRWVFCQNCVGNGHRSSSSTCLKCHGAGEMEESCSLKVWVPAGSQQGARLRITGEGDRLSPQAPPGDLVICLHII
jgi:molecular chaperone DnaJ